MNVRTAKFTGALMMAAGAVVIVASAGVTFALTRPAESDPTPVATTQRPHAPPAQATPEPVPTPDLAGAREAAERSVRRFYAGDFGGHWDTWDSQAQEIISREDYITRMEQCRPIAVGLTPQFGEFRLEGETEARFSFELFGFTFGERMVWEGGRWAYYVREENRERYALSAEEHLAAMRRDGACHNA